MCDFSLSMGCSTPGFPPLLHLPELAQTHVHWVGDANWPSGPLLFPSPLAFNISQHQCLFQWVSSSDQVSKVDPVSHSRLTQRLYIYLNSRQQFASELVLVWRLPVQRPLVSALQMDFSSVEIWSYFCSFSSHRGTGRKRSDIGQFVSILLWFTIPITLGRYSPPLVFPLCVPLTFC